MTLHSLEVGDGSLEVVFAHGLFGQGKNWLTIAKTISDLAHSHLPDMPNHGRSSWTLDFDYDTQADIVADWLHQHCTQPAVLVGHSMGGKIAMRVALRRPELLRGLVVVDISPARNVSALAFTSLVAGLKSLPLDSITSRGHADRALAERIPNDTVRRFLLQNLQRHDGHWSWMPNLDLLGDNLHEIGGWKPITGTYEGPTLWIAGGQSDYVRPEHMAPMREYFPTTRQVTLKRAGHWVHSEDPDAFVATLRAFLEQMSELSRP